MVEVGIWGEILRWVEYWMRSNFRCDGSYVGTGGRMTYIRSWDPWPHCKPHSFAIETAL